MSTPQPRRSSLLSRLLRKAVTVGDCEEVLRLLETGGRELLRSGLQHHKRPEAVPFAQVCVEAGRVAVLAAVVQRRPRGVALDDCLICEEVIGPLTVSILYCPAQAVLETADPALLDVLLEAKRSHPLEAGTDRDIGGLHQRVLEKLVLNPSSEECEGLAAMCRRLLSEATSPAPVGADINVGDALCSYGFWHKRPGAEFVPQLMRDYAAAGLFTLDDLVMRPADSYRNTRLLTAAITFGNPVFAATLIDMGCDWTKEVRKPHADLPSTIRALKRPGDEELAAAVTEALMRVRLRGEMAGSIVTESRAPGRRRAAV